MVGSNSCGVCRIYGGCDHTHAHSVHNTCFMHSVCSDRYLVRVIMIISDNYACTLACVEAVCMQPTFLP